MSVVRRQIDRLGWENAGWLVIVALIVGILGYLGWSFLPSNGDSLVYHLTRVEHWIQDGTVSPFPSHYLAQLELSPLSEFNLAHFHLLVGSDRLDAYVQFFACIVCLVAVSELARLLGGSRWTQVVSVVVCATIPTGVLLATSTENDYFAAAIGVCLIVVALGWPREGNWWFPSLTLGIGAGLGYMAKGTVPALIGPVLALLLLWNFRNEVRLQGVWTSIKRWVGILGVSVLAALVIVAPFVSQNVSLFGTPIGPVSKSTLSTDLTLPAAAANVVRSTASDFMMGNGRNGIETDISASVLGALHDVFDRFHIAPGDQRYALGTVTDAFAKRDYVLWDRSPDTGADPWDVVLICASVIVLIIAWISGDRRMRLVLLMAVGLILGYLLFSGTARWSVYDVRYQLPLYVAWSPVIAMALSKLPKMATRLLLCLLIIACLPQLFDNMEQPFLHQQFAAKSLNPYFLDTDVQSYISTSAAEFESASAAIAESSCQRVGLANWLLVEYPLWVGLKNAGWQGEIQDVMVQNVSSRLEDPTFKPCILLRQETGPYAGTGTGQVQLRFGPLALSFDPEAARAIRLSVPGFHSTVAGVHMLPGGGWSQSGTSTSPTLVGPGSVFLFSRDRRTMQFQVRSNSSSAAAQAEVSVPGSGIAPALVSSDKGIPIVVSPGITEVRLEPVANAPAPSTTVAGVDVVPLRSLG
jgi:hypothetical protein